MQELKDLLPKKKYKPTQPASFQGLPIRESVRNTRAVIDNEYFLKGYAKLFGSRVTTIYLYLAMRANQTTQTCFPSVDLMRKQSGVSNRNKIIQALSILLAYDIIHIGHAGGRVNYYALLRCSAWKPAGSIPIDTIIKPVSKKGSTLYQNASQSSIPVDTLNQLSKSVNEIKETDLKIKEDRPVRGLDRLRDLVQDLEERGKIPKRT